MNNPYAVFSKDLIIHFENVPLNYVKYTRPMVHDNKHLLTKLT